MKIKNKMTPLLLSLATLAITATAQVADMPPPVKMGLWQTEVTSTMSGMENTPMAAMAAHNGRTHINQSCLTREKWKEDIQDLNQRQANRECTMTNVHQDAKSLSFDQNCNSGGGKMTGHFKMEADDPEHMHGGGTMTMEMQGLPQPITVNTTIASHFMSSDCGSVKPGESKMIQ